MQLRGYQVLFSELSKEERSRLQVLRRLNDILGIESSFAGSPTEINRDEFNKAVEPILKDREVKSLFKYKFTKEANYRTLVNLIYMNWTRKAKVENSKKRVQVRGVDKTPFVAQPTTIAKKEVKETVVLWDHIKAKETFHVVNQCMKRTCLAMKA